MFGAGSGWQVPLRLESAMGPNQLTPFEVGQTNAVDVSGTPKKVSAAKNKNGAESGQTLENKSRECRNVLNMDLARFRNPANKNNTAKPIVLLGGC